MASNDFALCNAHGFEFGTISPSAQGPDSVNAARVDPLEARSWEHTSCHASVALRMKQVATSMTDMNVIVV